MMKDKLTDECERLIGFTAWVKKNYGMKVGGGLWKFSMQKHLILAIIQRWLREEKKINILSNHHEFGCSQDNGWYYSIGTSIKSDFICGKFKTYEEALEEGILKEIELIRNK